MSPEIVETVLAGLNVDRDLREAITGDLIEGRSKLMTARGQRVADRWMRQQVLRSVPAFIRAAVLAGGFRLIAAVLGGALAALAAVGAMIGASMALLAVLISTETIARFAVIALAIDLGYGAAGGYLAARIGRAAPLAAAFVFGVLGVSLTAILSADAQGWYRTALQLLLIPATVSGGWLHARGLARRAPST
jgi:hypothetical protein